MPLFAFSTSAAALPPLAIWVPITPKLPCADVGATMTTETGEPVGPPEPELPLVGAADLLSLEQAATANNAIAAATPARILRICDLPRGRHLRVIIFSR